MVRTCQNSHSGLSSYLPVRKVMVQRSAVGDQSKVLRQKIKTVRVPTGSQTFLSFLKLRYKPEPEATLLEKIQSHYRRYAVEVLPFLPFHSQQSLDFFDAAMPLCLHNSR